MFYVRSTSTKSGATAVQVVKYISRKTVVVKHIGSAHNKKDVKLLKITARQWIENKSDQMRLFVQRDKKSQTNYASPVLLVNQSQLISANSVFIYEKLFKLCCRLGFNKLTQRTDDQSEHDLLIDLTIARLIHPSSKLQSLRFLKEQFGIAYKKHFLYRQILTWRKLKPKAEEVMVSFAKRHLNFSFAVVFYDVTTLYFESFKNDTRLKQCGFSKDNKFNQPQIVIGLIVDQQGFPVSYGIFPGNTFEGHTFIPMIENLMQKHKIKSLTVVADAAMISQENIDQLKARGLNYIVGARLGNLSQKLVSHIQKRLSSKDSVTTRITTPKGDLICSFSQKRYKKDKYETKKQIKKAREAIRRPGKRRRLKFLSTNNSKLTLNKKLIEKTKLLWGIKGYYSNVSLLSDREIVKQYQKLWRVEKSFRIAKSDLSARPIYHRKTEVIKAHILICFLALGMAKYLEIKSGLSLKKCIEILKSVKDARIKNQYGQIITLRSKPSENVDNLLKKINLSY